MKMYIIKYRLYKFAEEKEIWVLAKNKIEAWDKATYVAIPYKEGEPAYSTWVDRVEYDNGNIRHFNTCEGLPY